MYHPDTYIGKRWKSNHSLLQNEIYYVMNESMILNDNFVSHLTA